MTTLGTLIEREIIEQGIPISIENLVKLKHGVENRLLQAQRSSRVTLEQGHILVRPLEDTSKTEKTPVFLQTRAELYGKTHISTPTEAELADLRTHNQINAILYQWDRNADF